MKKRLSLILVGLFLVAVINCIAGTIIFKDNTSISKVEIVGIYNGRIYIEKNDLKKNYPLSSVKAYYNEDIEIDSAINKRLVNYKARVNKVYFSSGSKKKSKSSKKTIRKTAEITFSLAMYQNSQSKELRQPYLYLYVLTEDDDSTTDNIKERKVYSFSYPRSAKVNLKSYSIGKIMSKVLASDRKIINRDNLNYTGTTVKIPFTIRKAKIIAYRLEVYNNDSLSAVKIGNLVGLQQIPKDWWYSIDYK
ncbi:hypothetical protein AAEX28_13885 [Lentisphaerota bacterium WC36G]|nr:hypothetical protein LJT99_00635 [Lentisphaerae bacterium WC36]